MKCKLSVILRNSIGVAMLLTVTTSCESMLASMGYVKVDKLCTDCLYAFNHGKLPDGNLARVERPVTGVVQNTESSIDKTYLNELLSMDYSIHQYLPEEPQRMVWLDDSIVESATDLSASLAQTSQSGGVRYMPQGVTMRNSENAIYFYYQTDAAGKPEPMRLRMQYFADDPLRFDRMEFRINGFIYGFKPSSTKTGKEGTRFYWENCDDALTEADKDLVYALAHADWVEMRLKGAGGMDHVKMLSKDQIKAFYSTLQLYRLQGGELK